MPDCSVIIPVFNRAALTRQCLERLLAEPPRSCTWELILVDDGSSDATPDLLRSYGSALQVVTHNQNQGFARTCNDGALCASSDLLIFLNNDTLPLEGWLDALVDYVRLRARVAVVGSMLLFPNNTIQHAGMVIGPDRHPHHIYLGFPSDHPAVNRSRRYQCVTGGCMLVRRSSFESVGGFDTAYRNGFEDVDLCLRLGERGQEVHYCHESMLFHLESVSEGRHKYENENARLFRERWASRIHADDWQYYCDDGLLQVTYAPHCPLRITFSHELALVTQSNQEPEAHHLLARRSDQVYELLRDNIRLRVQQQESAAVV